MNTHTRFAATNAAYTILPALAPSIAYWSTGGTSLQWRLAVATASWMGAVYLQTYHATARRPRVILGICLFLYFVATLFSFTVLGPVSIALFVLFAGLTLALISRRVRAHIPTPQSMVRATHVIAGTILTVLVFTMRFAGQ